MKTFVEEIRETQQSQGLATILAIGTATPPNCYNQVDYPDYYFRVTNSERMIDLKNKFKRICFGLHNDAPEMISDNIENILTKTVHPLGLSDWNSMFWIVHPGGRRILDLVELKLNLDKQKLRASRHVLSEYGNMTSSCVLFIIDEMRNKSLKDGESTTGEGLDWGVLFGFGPGLTVETVVLHSKPSPAIQK